MYEITTNQMQEAMKNDLAQMREEQAAGFRADTGTTVTGRFYIDTRITRDWRRSNNGGEYSFWTEYWYDADTRKTYRLERCSCDFWQPMDEPEFCIGRVQFPAA